MKTNLAKILAVFVLTLCLVSFAFTLVACNGGDDNNDVPDPQANYVDVVIFMGQSNMAGRGEAEDTVVCEEGHGYEFRAVEDPTKLYPVTEPFGANENNDALADLDSATHDGKKTGGMTSAFCEGYYQQTGRPVVGISASVGGTSVQRWVPGTSFFDESKRRLISCIDFLKSDGKFEIKHVFMVWCQGESDTTNWANGKGNYDYFGRLKSIIDGLKDLGNGYGVEKCFVVTPSEYSNGKISETKQELVNYMIEHVLADDDFVLVSKKFRNVPLGMRDDPHFHQGIYNVTGYDAAVNAAAYLETGKQPDCKEFILGEDVTLAEKFGITPAYTSI